MRMLTAGVWSLVLLIAFVFVPPRWRLPVRRSVLWLFLLALTVRVLPNLILKVGGGYDIESFALVGEMLANGREIYAATRHHQSFTISTSRFVSHHPIGLAGLVRVRDVALHPV